jgi:hydroxymethylbilane synthase
MSTSGTSLTSPVRVGTRNTPLAIARANSVAASLSSGSKNSPAVQAEVTVVDGTDADLLAALAASTVDVAVSFATTSADTVAAVVYPKRADSRDALCAAEGTTFDTLAVGSRVLVSSALRKAQVLARRADLVVDMVQSDTLALLDEVDAGTADASVVAVADLDRLHRLDAISEFLGIDGWPTEAGQGALEVTVRRGSEGLVKALGHNPTRTIVQAERQVRDALGEAGVLTGVHGIIDDGLLFLSARVYAPDGSERATASHALYIDDVAQPAVELAARVVTELVALGAREIAARSA